MSRETWWDDNLKTGPALTKFIRSLTDANAPDRARFREFLKASGYKSVIDCGGGPAIDWYGARRGGFRGRWLILDSSKALIKRAETRGADCRLGSIEQIPSRASAFDVAFSRHVFQHLKDFNPALSEMVRVARKVVYVQFQRVPAEREERIKAKVYRNTYAIGAIAAFLDSCEKVSDWKLERGALIVSVE